MATTPTAAAMSLTHLVIPHDQLAAALRAAFDALVAMLNDRKAHPRERRLAATAILRLAPKTLPDAGPESSKARVSPPSPHDAPRADEAGATSLSPCAPTKVEGRGEGSSPTPSSNLQRPVDHLRAHRVATHVPRGAVKNEDEFEPSPPPLPPKPGKGEGGGPGG